MHGALMTDIEGYEASFSDRSSKIWRVYAVLRDRQWHCRECEYTHIKISQIAGGAGIQGLERGTKSRPGLEIESNNHYCKRCDRVTRQDKWQGNFVQARLNPTMPDTFVRRAVDILGSRDVVEGTERPYNQLTLDHKLPQIRWNKTEMMVQTDYSSMTDADIRAKFQLLKKSNGSVSHNLLKSRACEECYRSGQRGTPLGIAFFYLGTDQWPSDDKEDASGCVGCGWYDFAAWRAALNEITTAQD